MTPVDINYLAVLVVAVVHFALGALWYSPVLFATPWMSVIGKTREQIEAEVRGDRMIQSYGFTFVAYLVMAYILSHIVDYTAADSIWTGALSGFWMWLGFVATTILTVDLFENRGWKHYLIHVGYHLVGIVIMGAILAVWS
ncbi:MAG: DUF1761 domain-containing protein [Fidelibacterota bacterium]|nr:MAG: DUF1761 domain-containing protein [Candidatus Neomarinimicrobiota bacterium]